MSYILPIILCFFLSLPSPSTGHTNEATVASDATILSTFLSEAVHTALDSIAPHSLQDRNIRVTVGHGIKLTAWVQNAIAASCTAKGFLLTDTETGAARLDVAITHAEVILKRSGKILSRVIRLDVHIQCYDSDSRLIYAGHRSFEKEDRFRKAYEKATNDSRLFSTSLSRTVIPGSRFKLRLVSVTVITGVLTWLAFK